jgi:8-oxo-dGTP diphosphatase
MIQNNKGEILIQNRVKSWKGLAFPGGHLEFRESIVDSVIREIKEETGLIVSDLKICGVKQAFFDDGSRYIVYLYKTNNFIGNLKSTEEGENYWISIEDLLSKKEQFANNFEYMLQVFLNDDLTEHYHSHNGEQVIDILK